MDPLDSLKESEKDGLMPIFLLYSPTSKTYVNISTGITGHSITVTETQFFNTATIFSSRVTLESLVKYILANGGDKNLFSKYYIQTLYAFLPYLSLKEQDKVCVPEPVTTQASTSKDVKATTPST